MGGKIAIAIGCVLFILLVVGVAIELIQEARLNPDSDINIPSTIGVSIFFVLVAMRVLFAVLSSLLRHKKEQARRMEEWAHESVVRVHSRPLLRPAETFVPPPTRREEKPQAESNSDECWSCNGSGVWVCSSCQGSGSYYAGNFGRKETPFYKDCRRCGGRGDMVCRKCGGTGRYPRKAKSSSRN